MLSLKINYCNSESIRSHYYRPQDLIGSSFFIRLDQLGIFFVENMGQFNGGPLDIKLVARKEVHSLKVLPLDFQICPIQGNRDLNHPAAFAQDVTRPLA